MEGIVRWNERGQGVILKPERNMVHTPTDQEQKTSREGGKWTLQPIHLCALNLRAQSNGSTFGKSLTII